MTVHLISVIGSSPGVGKSPLCRAVAEEFAGGAAAGARPETLVESTRAYVAESVATGREYLVTDALLPFIPSLLA
ncbi:hypothetical protein ACIQVO_10960 [Streptomyces sp. NPDC101062]|uniref:hypothetical protein n=1 Tax=unclassified Streptomyces TaxID=2593676 RepID=UPI0038063473